VKIIALALRKQDHTLTCFVPKTDIQSTLSHILKSLHTEIHAVTTNSRDIIFQ